MKRFKTHKKINILSLFVLIALFLFGRYLYINLNIVDDEKMFIDLIARDSSYANLYKINETNFINKFIKNFLKIDFNNPLNMIKNKFIYNKTTTVSKEMNQDPIVYIYNTHQKEEYSDKYISDYNINPGVYMASFILEKKLEEYGIETLVEESDMYKHMEQHNFTNPYYSSQQLVAHAIKEYPNLKLIIDLHRDSPTKSYTTVTINNKNYAKTMFVQGINYEDYKINRKIVEILDDKLNKYYKGLSKGIYEKNDDFNQYINNNMILIEVGGYQNTIDEVSNSLDALALVIKEYIEEYTN